MTEPGSVQIRHATDADLPAILSLMAASLGAGTLDRSEAVWRWKHLSNPFGRSPVLVALDGERLVGLRSFMRWTWTVDGRAVPAVRAVDTATHPDCQGRGIFKKLTLRLLNDLEADESASFVFNTPNSKSKPGYLKMGWAEVARFPVAIRPRRPLRMAAAAIHRARPADLDLLASDTPGLAAPNLREVLDQLPSPPGRLRTRRTLAYLRWRYAGVPGLAYAIDARTHGEVGAVVISRLNTIRGLSELRICEWLHTPGDEGKVLARRLLDDRLRRQSHDFASIMPGPEGALPAMRCGFVTVPRSGLTLTARPLRDSEPRPLRPGSWSLSTGDVELF